MPWIKGYLITGERPSHPIAEPPVDPGYGVETPPEVIWGGRPPLMPSHPIELPEPPPGVFPPPSPVHPIAPVPPTVNPQPPPGSVWLPIEGGPSAKFWIVAYIPGHGFKFVCIDPGLKPTPAK